VIWFAALAVGAIAGFWLLGRHAPPPEEVRTTPLPSAESPPRAPAERPADVAPRGVNVARGVPAPALRRANPLDRNQPALTDEGARAGRTPAAPQAAPQSVRAGRARPLGTRNSARSAEAPRLAAEAPAEPQLAIDPIDETLPAESDQDLEVPAEAAAEDESPIDGDVPGAEPERIAAPHPSPRGAAATPARAGPARPLQASARIADLTVRGSLTTSEVRRALERIRPQLNACYTRVARAAGRNGYGAMNVEIEIDERGRAHAPRASGGALPGLDACVAQAAGKIVAGRPPDTGTVKASWKVAFSP
jgi:hypothetical protein